jgi:hypothetical protein
MSVDMIVPEKLAMLVHHYREALALDFGCRPSTSPDWEDLSQEERSRLVAATRLALLDIRVDIRGEHTQRTPSDSLPYQSIGGGSEGKECGC